MTAEWVGTGDVWRTFVTKLRFSLSFGRRWIFKVWYSCMLVWFQVYWIEFKLRFPFRLLSKIERQLAGDSTGGISMLFIVLFFFEAIWHSSLCCWRKLDGLHKRFLVQKFRLNYPVQSGSPCSIFLSFGFPVFGAVSQLVVFLQVTQWILSVLVTSTFFDI